MIAIFAKTSSSLSKKRQFFAKNFWRKYLKNHNIGLLQYSSNGQRYEGNFDNDSQNGLGKFFWPNGDVYFGHFVDNFRTGNGTFTWENGDVYQVPSFSSILPQKEWWSVELMKKARKLRPLQMAQR
jgi:hypothetical protein